MLDANSGEGAIGAEKSGGPTLKARTARLWRWRADRARDRRDWGRAAANYRRYLAAAPGDGSIWMQLGHAAKEMGDLDRAKSAYRRSRDLGEGEAERHLAAIWNLERLGAAASASREGDAARDARDWPAASAAYARHLDMLPDDGLVWVQYGHALREMGDLPGAMMAYRQAVGLEDTEEDGHFQLACLLREAGQTGAAREHFRQALAIVPRLGIFRHIYDTPERLADAIDASDRRLLVLDISDLMNFLGAHGQVTGIQRVQAELVRAMLAERRPRLPAEFDEVVFCFSEYGWPWMVGEAELRALLAHVDAASLDAAGARRFAEHAKSRATPCAPGPGSAFVVLGGFWGGDELAFQRRRLAAMDVAFGVMVHDLFAITMPELCMEGVVAKFAESLIAGLGSWDFILANSHFTAGDIEAFIARTGAARTSSPGQEAPAPPVIAVPLAHGLSSARDRDTQAPAALSAELEGERFVLCVGTIEPRKNHALLIEAWARLGQDHPDLPLLVLAGRRGWRTDLLTRRLENGALNATKVRWLQDVSDERLDALYQACLFTVFPSFAEGWGLPVGESLAHGKLCVTSNRTAMPEVGGRFAVYADPHDGDDLRRTLETVLYDGKTLERRHALIRRSFRPRRWPQVAEDLVAAVAALQTA